MATTTFNSNADFNIDSASAMLAKNWWLFLLRGIFGIVFGLLALLFPGPTMLSLVLLFSAYMLVDGIAGIISAVRAMRRKDQWGLLILEGLLNIALGVAAFIWPGLTVFAFVFMVAAWAIVSGALMMSAGFRLKLDHGRWWMVFGGLLSVVYGALLVAMPLIGLWCLRGGWELTRWPLALRWSFCPLSCAPARRSRLARSPRRREHPFEASQGALGAPSE